jgi:hypothetical protein
METTTTPSYDWRECSAAEVLPSESLQSRKKKSRMGENALHQTTWRHASFITNWLFSYLSSHVFQFFSSPWLLPLEGKSQTSLFTVQS